MSSRSSDFFRRHPPPESLSVLNNLYPVRVHRVPALRARGPVDDDSADSSTSSSPTSMILGQGTRAFTAAAFVGQLEPGHDQRAPWRVTRGRRRQEMRPSTNVV